jgi:S-methylmethionine-dependent homocysteine/selenocysteine methylase
MTGAHYLAGLPVTAAYERIDGLLQDGGCVVLDGGVATELQRVRTDDRDRGHEPWGTWALFRGPMEVLEVHSRYVASGCDVISTNTWSVLEAAAESAREHPDRGGRGALWIEAARLGIRLARQAIDEAGIDTAVAFCINSSLLDKRAAGRLELLSWMWQVEPPDLVILETLETVPDDVAVETIAMVVETGLPVWVSFRRRPDAMTDEFRASLDRLAGVGASAILVNCVPAADVAESVAWLRERTALPVGCYPNLGHGAGSHWEFDAGVGPGAYAELAASWAGAGARIVGGCCGVTPEHVAALRGAMRR